MRSHIIASMPARNRQQAGIGLRLSYRSVVEEACPQHEKAIGRVVPGLVVTDVPVAHALPIGPLDRPDRTGLGRGGKENDRQGDRRVQHLGCCVDVGRQAGGVGKADDQAVPSYSREPQQFVVPRHRRAGDQPPDRSCTPPMRVRGLCNPVKPWQHRLLVPNYLAQMGRRCPPQRGRGTPPPRRTVSGAPTTTRGRSWPRPGPGRPFSTHHQFPRSWYVRALALFVDTNSL